MSIGSQEIQPIDLAMPLWYMNKMTPCSENSLQHLAVFILMFLSTSVRFLGSNSNDGALKAEKCYALPGSHTGDPYFRQPRFVTVCFHSDFTRINTLITTSRRWL